MKTSLSNSNAQSLKRCIVHTLNNYTTPATVYDREVVVRIPQPDTPTTFQIVFTLKAAWQFTNQFIGNSGIIPWSQILREFCYNVPEMPYTDVCILTIPMEYLPIFWKTFYDEVRKREQ